MQISIVILTIDCEDHISTLMESIKKNKIDEKAEVIVVDAASRDKTVQIVKSFKFPKIVQVDRISKGKARNIGMKKSSGEVIAYLDSDIEVLPGWYEALKKNIGTHDIVAGYSVDPKRREIGRVPILVDGCDITYPTCNIAYKREIFDMVGLFTEVQEIPEDCEFHYRCVKKGHPIYYEPKMKVYHHQNYSLFGFARQAFWNGEARYELNKAYPELRKAHQHGFSIASLLRLGFGFMGFTIGRFHRKRSKIGKRYHRQKDTEK